MGCCASIEGEKVEHDTISLEYDLEIYQLQAVNDNIYSFKLNKLFNTKFQKSNKTFINQLSNCSYEFILNLIKDKESINQSLYYIYSEEKIYLMPYAKIIPFKPMSKFKLKKICILLIKQFIDAKLNSILIRELLPDISEADLNIVYNFEEKLKELEKIENPNITEDSLSIDNYEDDNIQESDDEEDEKLDDKGNKFTIENDININSVQKFINKIKEKEEGNIVRSKLSDNNIKNNTIKTLVITNINLTEININKYISLILLLEELFEYEYLKKLYITNVIYDFTDNKDFFTNVINLIKINTNIRVIKFTNFNIYDNQLRQICRALSYKRFRVLDLKENFITKVGAKYISDLINNNKTLQKLYLSNNSSFTFKSDGVNTVLTALSSSINIQTLDFSMMEITGCGIYIKTFLSTNKSLKELYLHSCKLNLQDFKNICSAVIDNNNIELLDIGMNNMASDLSLKEVSNMIINSKSLKALNLNDMNINKNNYNIIFDAIPKNQNITKYYLSYNSELNHCTILKSFLNLNWVKYIEYVPYDPTNDIYAHKTFNIEEKKIIDKLQEERKDLTLVI